MTTHTTTELLTAAIAMSTPARFLTPGQSAILGKVLGDPEEEDRTLHLRAHAACRFWLQTWRDARDLDLCRAWKAGALPLSYTRVRSSPRERA
jgi:hypothetical protein